MNRLPRKERINHNNRFFLDPEKEREREKPGFCQDLYQPPNRKIEGAGSKRRKSHGIIPLSWNENILVGSRILPTLRFINIPNDLYDPLYSTLHPSPSPFCFFFFASFYFPAVEKRLDDYSRGEFRDFRFRGGATRSRWRWLHRSDSRDICIWGQARLILFLDLFFFFFFCYFWKRVGKILARLFRS